MRICFVMEYHPQDHAGGSEVQAFAVASELARAGHEVFYVCQRFDRERPAEDAIDGVTVLRAVEWRRTWRFLGAGEVSRAVSRIRPDIVYQRMASPFTGVAARAAAKVHVPFVWGCAEDASLEPRFLRRASRPRGGGLVAAGKRAVLWGNGFVSDLLLGYGIRRAAAVVVQNRDQEGLLRQRFGMSGSIIPNGIRVDGSPAARSGRPVVLWLNRMIARKRPELFVELAEQVGALHPDARFVMVGGRADDEYGRRIADAARGVPALELVGGVPQAATQRWFEDAWVFVMTSWGEGFPNVLLQAWVAGAAVVSLEVDPDGLLSSERLGVLSGTVAQMGEDVARLLEDSAERQGYASRAYDYVAEHLDIRRVAERYAKLFETVAAARSNAVGA